MKRELSEIDFSQEIQDPFNNGESQLAGQLDIQFEDANFVQQLNENFDPSIRFGFKFYDIHQSKAWTQQDQDKLLALHKRFGNKWTRLAQHYPGKSENFIKNHFYSRLRKSVRKLNKLIVLFFHGQFIKFKLNIIFKLSNISQGKISDKEKIDSKIFNYYREFLYRLIEFSENQEIDEKSKNLSEQQKIKLKSLALSLINPWIEISKRKEKNIAYLRQFEFRLDVIDPIQLVISKERIYLKSNQYVADPVESQKDYSFRIGPSESSEDQNKQDSYTVYQLLTPNLKRTINIDSINTSVIDQQPIDFQSPIFVQEEVGTERVATQNQDWTDYLGRHLQEIDINGLNLFNSERDLNENSHESLNLDEELFPSNSMYPYYQ